MVKKFRVPIPEEIAAEIMFLADRKCCVCNTKAAAQIHHIDENPSNNSIDNLAPLCFDCHNDTMLKGGFSRKIDAAQIRLYKANWLERVKKRRNAISETTDEGDVDIVRAKLNEVSYPVSVSEKSGDIFIKFSDGVEKRMPHTGNDSKPILHQSTHRVVFFRDTENGREIFTYALNTNTIESIVCPCYNSDLNRHLSNLSDLHFSPNGLFLYFSSSAWTTSSAIHRYDFNLGSEQFISAGNSLEVVRFGEYKGFLVVCKHKYWDRGGSYDHYWLLTSEGKEVEDLGNALDGVQLYLNSRAAQ